VRALQFDTSSLKRSEFFFSLTTGSTKTRRRIALIVSTMPRRRRRSAGAIRSARVNSLGSDFGVGTGANGGIGTVGVWNYRCAVHPLHTGKFTVAIDQSQIADGAAGDWRQLRAAASLQIFLGDKLSVTNNAQVAYTFRIDNSLGNLIIQFYINIGETK
jgi:hypothetical protein